MKGKKGMEELEEESKEKIEWKVFRDHLKKYQGPVVQSIVSLTSLLRVISLTVIVDSIYNILIFIAEKMWVAYIFSAKNFSIFAYHLMSILTNR